MDKNRRKALKILAVALLVSQCITLLCSCSFIYSSTPNEGEKLEKLLAEFFPKPETIRDFEKSESGHQKNNWGYPSNELYYNKLTFEKSGTYLNYKVLFNEKYPDDTERVNSNYTFDDPIIDKGTYELHIKDLRDSGSYYPSQFLPVIGFNDDNKEILFLYYYDGGASFESVENLFEKEGGLFPKKELIYD